MRNLVIIPTYNELDNIRPMIDKVFSLPEKFDLLVIDDGSPDGTAEIVRERQKAYPESLHLIERQGKLAAAAEGADLVIGSRYVTGVNVVNWPMKRVLMSYYASAYVRAVTGMPVRDATAGFVCYSAKLLRTMDMDAVEMKGYGFQVEMKYTAWKLGFRIKEVPIIFTERTQGASKMSGGIFREAFFGVLKLRFRTIKPRA